MKDNIHIEKYTKDSDYKVIVIQVKNQKMSSETLLVSPPMQYPFPLHYLDFNYHNLVCCF